MIQKITQNNGNFWTVNLIMRAKIVNQSSDFPVRRTGSYRHKKHWSYDTKCVRYCRRRSGNGGVAFRAHAKASRLCFTVVESFFSVCLSIHLLCQSARFFPHHINSRRPLTYTTTPCSHPNTHTKKATTVNQLDQLSLSSFRACR